MQAEDKVQVGSDKIIADQLAMLPGFENQHPLVNSEQGTGMLSSLYELQQALEIESGYASFSFLNAGIDPGLFSIIAMIKTWHQRNSKLARSEFVVIGDPAPFDSVARQINFDLLTPPRAITSVDRPWARLNCGDNTACVFLFPPAGVNISIADVRWIADRVHYCGGLIVADSGICQLIKRSGIDLEEIVDLYLLDLNQLFGVTTVSTSNNCFALAAGERLSPLLPVPRLVMEESEVRWSGDDEYPLSVGRTGAFGANKFALLSLAIELQLHSAQAQ
jgi:glycine dehydrogenase subunit 2